MNVNLGGNVNLIGREPRDGRTFETKGEDPILAGKITAAHIRAIQDQHVIGGIKHYALERSGDRARTTANVQIDERGARESDLLAFEIGIKDSNVQSVMCSYNLVNGAVCLRESAPAERRAEGRLGLPGLRDVGLVGHAQHGRGGDRRPGSGAARQPYFASLGQAVADGQVPQSRLDNMVHRILRAMYEVGIFDYPKTFRPIDSGGRCRPSRKQVGRAGRGAAEECRRPTAVEAPPSASIAVIGSNADAARALRRRIGAGVARRRRDRRRLPRARPAGRRWSGIRRRR